MNRIESLAGRKGAAHAGSVPAARSKRRRLAWGGAAAFVFAASAVWGASLLWTPGEPGTVNPAASGYARIPVKAHPFAGELLTVDISKGTPFGQLPFDVNDVTELRIYETANEKDEYRTLSDAEYGVVMPDLLTFHLGRTTYGPLTARDYPYQFSFRVKDGSAYAVPYDFNENMFRIGDSLFFAYPETLTLMHALYKPDSPWGQWGEMMRANREERDRLSAIVSNDIGHGPEAFEIGGKDYTAWEIELLAHLEPDEEIPYHDPDTARFGQSRVFEQQGILELPRTIVFMKDNVSTPGGVSVGTGRERAAELLGSPNLQLESEWSYLLGETTFSLYFADDKVKFMALTKNL